MYLCVWIDSHESNDTLASCSNLLRLGSGDLIALGTTRVAVDFYLAHGGPLVRRVQARGSSEHCLAALDLLQLVS